MIKVTWYHESCRAILWKVSSTFTLEEFKAASHRTSKMIAYSPSGAGIYTIMDVRDVKQIPQGLLQTLIHEDRAKALNPNHQMTLIIGMNSIIHLMINIVMRLPGSSRRYMIVDTMQDVLAHINIHGVDSEAT